MRPASYISVNIPLKWLLHTKALNTQKSPKPNTHCINKRKHRMFPCNTNRLLFLFFTATTFHKAITTFFVNVDDITVYNPRNEIEKFLVDFCTHFQFTIIDS